jgi:hypothetical protein
MAVQFGWTEAPKVSLVASAAIELYDQVAVTGNKTIGPAGSGGAAIGVALSAATATGVAVDVVMYNGGGTVPAINAGTCPAGSAVYAFTSGLVKSTTTAASGTACRLGVCVSGSTATLSRIEFAPGISPKTT